jgi:hypothetical protein
MTIYAIPLTYHGATFRSHLEADWAATFDALGWTWSYEPEPYTGDGVRYLPDFWLPAQRIWIEIKGPHDERISKTWWFAASQDHDPYDINTKAVAVLRAAGPGRAARWERAAGRHAIDLADCLRCKYMTLFHPNAANQCRICGHHPPGPATDMLILARAPRFRDAEKGGTLL